MRISACIGDDVPVSSFTMITGKRLTVREHTL